MRTGLNVIDYADCQPRMFLELADIARENDRLRRYWITNYMRVSTAQNKEAQR